MKKICVLSLSVFALIVIAKSVYAEDESPWRGIYIGANAGWSWDHRSSTLSTTTGTFLAHNRRNTSGIEGGAQLGTNFLVREVWVVGAEGDVSGGDLHATVVGTPGLGKYDVTADLFGTARARVGFITDSCLIYGTGGFAWAFESIDRSQQSITVANAPPGTTESDRQFGTGWVAGGGVEWGFAPHYTFRLEYLHHEIGSKSFSFSRAQQRVKMKSEFDVVRFGINYLFN